MTDIPSQPDRKLDNPFAAVVLAGSRPERDELSEMEREPLKAFIQLAGIPMIDYVLKAILRSGFIDDIYVCIDKQARFENKAPLLNQLVTEKKITLVDTGDGPSASASNALNEINETKPVLITTADHPLLTRAILKEFLQKSLRSSCDATLGVIPTDIIENAYPNSKRTRIKFREGGYTGCNLFTLLSREARTLPDFWQDIEAMRKTPFNMATFLGPFIVTQYILGLLSLNKTLNKVSEKTGVTIQAVRMHQPEAGIDVDTPEDLSLVKDIIQNY